MQANYVAAVAFKLSQQLERKSHREWEWQAKWVGGMEMGAFNGEWKMENGEQRTEIGGR